ncbi:MAG: regulator of competence-specific s [Holophagaceae bacterium]|nr:regulator of competence-specific s [Holophagaceae bacterium]
MSVSPSYRDYVLDQLRQVTPVSSRAMFGGLMIYAEGFPFALIAEDRLYFKVDESNRPDFEALGQGPFLPFGDTSKPMSYFELPEELLEEPEDLAPWVNAAIQVARRKAKPKR